MSERRPARPGGAASKGKRVLARRRRVLSDQPLECRRVGDDDPASAELHPAGFRPLAEMLVHDLPGDAEEMRELGLRDSHFERFTVAAGGSTVQLSEYQEPLGRPGRARATGRSPHELARSSETATNE